MNDGGPAFPSDNPQILVPQDLPEEWKLKIAQIASKEKGMSLRDWFAGMALSGVLLWDSNKHKQEIVTDQYIALHCYQLADAMLKEREKTNDRP